MRDSEYRIGIIDFDVSYYEGNYSEIYSSFADYGVIIKYTQSVDGCVNTIRFVCWSMNFRVLNMYESIPHYVIHSSLGVITA